MVNWKERPGAYVGINKLAPGLGEISRHVATAGGHKRGERRSGEDVAEVHVVRKQFRRMDVCKVVRTNVRRDASTYTYTTAKKCFALFRQLNSRNRSSLTPTIALPQHFPQYRVSGSMVPSGAMAYGRAVQTLKVWTLFSASVLHEPRRLELERGQATQAHRFVGTCDA